MVQVTSTLTTILYCNVILLVYRNYIYITIVYRSELCMNKWCVQYESSIFVLILVTLYPFIAEMLMPYRSSLFSLQIWILVQISDLPVKSAYLQSIFIFM